MELKTNTQNYGFLFSNREMSPAEKTAKAQQSFLDQLHQACNPDAETSNKSKADDIQELLQKIKNAYKLSREEWTDVLKRLKDDGKISQEDYQLANFGFTLIPLGYKDAQGNFVKYDTESIMGKRLSAVAQGQESDGWDGDPIKYLDNWLETLRTWKNSMLRQTKPDGTAKYDNFAPLDTQINSISRVINELLALL